jgi:hypothetical protein
LYLDSGQKHYEKYYYTITNERKTEVEHNDKNIETSSTSEIGLTYEISKDSTGNHKLKLVYDKFHIKLKDLNGEQEINAANGANSYNPIGKILNNLVGSAVTVTLSPKGDVLSVSGTQEISAKILTGVNAEDPNVRKNIQEQISKLAGESFIKNTLQQGFTIGPDTAVQVGDSWQSKTSQEGEIKFDAVSTYTLKSVKNGMARINEESTITNPGTTSTVMGYEAMSNMKGKQEGYVETDMKTGMLLQSESTTSIKGTMQIMGREVPVDITFSKKMKGRKIPG